VSRLVGGFRSGAERFSSHLHGRQDGAKDKIQDGDRPRVQDGVRVKIANVGGHIQDGVRTKMANFGREQNKDDGRIQKQGDRTNAERGREQNGSRVGFRDDNIRSRIGQDGVEERNEDVSQGERSFGSRVKRAATRPLPGTIKQLIARFDQKTD
jgi:hypothetical protein